MELTRCLSRRKRLLLQVLDMFLVATEYKFRQFWATEILAAIYIIFNVAYFFLGTEDDTVIYSVLDWEDNLVGAVVFVVILFIAFLPLTALIFLGLFRYDMHILLTHRGDTPATLERVPNHDATYSGI